MRIRTQLLVSAVLACVLSALVVASLLFVTRQMRNGMDDQADSQEVARVVANLLALTNEFSLYGSERAAVQWRARHAQLLAAVDHAVQRRDARAPELDDLRRNVADLGSLFETLMQVGPAQPSTLAQRRREFLLERLLIETQEVVESRHRWALAVGQAQRRDHEIFQMVAIATPAALLLVVISLAALVGRRVLPPLQRLQAAVTGIRGGNLAARCASDAPDELGDAARAVDAMAEALQEREAALRTSERRLRLVMDSLPALVSHIDTQERYLYANEHFRRIGAGDPDAMIGRTMRDERGEELYGLLAPYVARALRGETVQFETSRLVRGSPAHRQVSYVPDRDEAGNTRGFYALTFDITARKETELRLAASERHLRDLTNNIPAMVAYFDMQERCQYANDLALRILGVERSAMSAITLRAALGDASYDQHRPYVVEALNGRSVRFEGKSLYRGRDAHFQAHLIPDLEQDGTQRGFYAMSFDITPLKQVEAQLNELARIDALTGLPNRRQFEDRIAGALAESAASGRPLAVMFLDVDHFKTINDRFGHAVGDLVLKEFATRLGETVRATDTAARLAGDEFVVLLEGVPEQHDVEHVARKVIAAIREPFTCAELRLAVTTSIGVAYCTRPHPPSELLACADGALYEAKAAGRNTFRVRRLPPADPAPAERGIPATGRHVPTA
jgi:diguanylate cyclase (GGDEF)-like protein/PAS domain S-box-containing protein